MSKKMTDGLLPEEKDDDVFDGENFGEYKIKESAKPAPKRAKEGVKAEVYAIVKGNLMVKLENGSIHRVFITKEYEKVKVGDTIYL